MDFEWDPEKALSNSRKHGVTFHEASEVFADELSSAVSDPDHSVGEPRFLLFGATKSHRYLVVSYTERGRAIRIFSAREMTRQERRAYEQ